MAETIHVNAFVQLDPREAIVRCTCGARLGPAQFMEITTNHASGEAAMRWGCPVCAYHPYAAMPIGEEANYKPVFMSWDGYHRERNGQKVTVRRALGMTQNGREYLIRFPDNTELIVTRHVFADPEGYARRTGAHAPMLFPYKPVVAGVGRQD